MINIIPIIIDERGSVKKDIQILAMEGENLSKEFSILLPNSILDKWLYIEFEKADGTKFVSERLIANGSYLEYDITNQMTVKGKLICQVIAKDGNNLKWKSNKFDFTISSSINAMEEIPASKPDILADLQRQIDDIEIGGGGITEESDPTVPSYVKSITEADIEKWNSNSGGSSKVIQTIEGSTIVLQPNTHTVITGVSNSLNISIAEEETSELKNYSFEFTSIDRIPKVTFTNLTAPYNYEYEKYKGYVGEIINNKVCYKTIYDAYPYQFIYGTYASEDWTSSYYFKNDLSVTYVNDSTTKTGKYSISLNNGIYSIYIEYTDSTDEYITMTDQGTFTSNGVVYTKS